MTLLKFNHPYKITHTSIGEEYISIPTPANYQRTCFVVTKYGIVIVEDMKWKNNFGEDCFTFFSTVLNGLKHSAVLEEGKLSDRRIKWMATHFIKAIKPR